MFQEQVSLFSPVQMHLKTCHEILVLERMEILVVGKGLVVFITSSTGKEYDEYAHNKI